MTIDSSIIKRAVRAGIFDRLQSTKWVEDKI